MGEWHGPQGPFDIPDIPNYMPLGQLYGIVQQHALVVSMKEIYGWLLILAIASFVIIAGSYGYVRPSAIFPKWKRIRKIMKVELQR